MSIKDLLNTNLGAVLAGQMNVLERLDKFIYAKFSASDLYFTFSLSVWGKTKIHFSPHNYNEKNYILFSCWVVLNPIIKSVALLGDKIAKKNINC